MASLVSGSLPGRSWVTGVGVCVAVCSPSLGYKTFFWVLIQFCPCKDAVGGVWQAKGWDSECVSKTYSALRRWL